MGFSLRNKLKGENSSSEVYTTAVDGSDTGNDVAHADLHLRRVKEQHRWDPFMDYEKIDAVDAALATGDAEKEAAVEESILQDDSPYLEVRSSVSLPLLSHASLCRANMGLGKTN